MMKTKTKGWLRLGVVVSTLFIVVFHGFVAHEYTEVKEGLAVSNLDTKKYGEWETIGQEGKFIRCSIDTPPITCSIKKESYFLALLIPLVVLWLILPGLMWAFSWVRAGFKDAV